MISHSVIILTNLKEYVNIRGKHSLFMHLLMVLRRFSHVVHSSWIILNGYWMEWFSGMELLELPSCYCWFVWSHSPMLVTGSAELCSLMVLHHHQSMPAHWLSMVSRKLDNIISKECIIHKIEHDREESQTLFVASSSGHSHFFLNQGVAWGWSYSA